MKYAWLLTFGIVGGLLGVGLIFLLTRPPRGNPVTLLPPPTPRPIVVHVAGAVVHPGLYSLPAGNRWADAIEAAGGLEPGANPTTLNLAAALQDGERVYVPAIVLQPDTPAATNPAPITAPPITRSAPGEPLTGGIIDINTASLEELDSLPGIGPATAQKIIDHRQTYGPFSTIESIQDVTGIGQAKFDAIKDMISVGGSP